jgi:hypothetical protein
VNASLEASSDRRRPQHPVLTKFHLPLTRFRDKAPYFAVRNAGKKEQLVKISMTYEFRQLA